MFQNLKDEIFMEQPNVFGIVHEILVVGYDETWPWHNTKVSHADLP